MIIQDIQRKIHITFNYLTEDVNQLLDYTNQLYLKEHLTILEYKEYIQLLESLGATKPDFFFRN